MPNYFPNFKQHFSFTPSRFQICQFIYIIQSHGIDSLLITFIDLGGIISLEILNKFTS